jgi:hypothetical protein
VRALLVLAFLSLSPDLAAAQVDPSGAWRTLHTAHFRIHFRPAQRALAQRAAREAERSWSLLAGELHPPGGAVDLTLGDDVDVSNGFTTVFPSNRITLFVTPPATSPELAEFDDWLRLVTTHELTHVFHLDRTKGWWSAVRTLFGRVPGFFPNEYQPSWVAEGLAVYYETRFTGGGRIAGAYHTQILAADAAAGRSRSPWTAVYFSRWPDGTAPYAYGGRFFARLDTVAGDSAVPRFIERTSGQLIPYRVGRQVRRATGRDLVAQWDSMVAATAVHAAADPGASIDADLWTEPVPRVSPRGRVAYVHDDGKGPAELRIVDAASRRVQRRHRVNGRVEYDWLGDTLVVTQLDFTDLWHVRSDRYDWTPDGRWRRMTRGARVTAPRGGGGVLATVLLTASGNGPSLPGVDTAGAVWGDVVPSPDGRWIAATRHKDGHWALVRWPAAAPDSLITLYAAGGGGGGVVADPVWQGRALLFVSEQSGLPQVYRWAEGALERVTAAPLGARAPAALPDGSLLYTTFGPAGWRLVREAPGEGGSAEAAAAPAASLARFDSAPPVAARETGYALWPSLRPHFWIPLGADAGAAGRFGGALIAGSDAIGRYSYLADAMGSLDPRRFAGSVAFLSYALGDPVLDLDASNDWALVGIDSAATVVSERDQEAALGATFVARRWRTLASVRLAAEYEGRRFVTIPDTTLAAICPGCRTRDRVGGSALLRVAHLTGGLLAISPVSGFDASVLWRRREQQASALWSNEVRSRLAVYQPLPGPTGFAHPVLALRLAAGGTSGPMGKTFGVGGVSSGTLSVGFAASVGGGRDFPVRGYPGGTLFGRRAATASLEYRVPLALVGRAVGHLPFGVDRVWLAVFGDLGDAWEPGEPARLHRLRSVGAELVADLTVSYDLPLGLRFGVARPLTDLPPGRPAARAYLAVGSDF